MILDLQILDRLLPCFIITPLDCFWEGAKLLGPRPALYINPTLSVTWANLRPLELLDQFLELPSDSIQAKLTTYKDLMLQVRSEYLSFLMLVGKPLCENILAQGD